MDRILLTGAAGFVGRAVAKHLAQSGISIGCVLRERSATSVLPDGAAVFRHDGGTAQLHDIVRGFAPRCIVHLASYFVAEHRSDDVEPLIRSNLLLATQLADAAVAAGVMQFVNTGTAWQHYDGPDYNPVSLYAATKQAFDDILRYYRERYGLRVVTLKLSDTYGPGDRRKKLLPLLIENLGTGRSLDLSPGEQRINPVFIDDVAAAYARALDIVASLAPGAEAVYAVTGMEQPSLRELAAIVEQEVGEPLNIRWGMRPYRMREVMVPWQGPTLPGWHPRVDLAAGIRRLLGKR